VAVGLGDALPDADPEADALADGFAFFVTVGVGRAGGGEKVAYS
jgi:hypothetical protein